jgi:hypothetical protein
MHCVTNRFGVLPALGYPLGAYYLKQRFLYKVAPSLGPMASELLIFR